jgi:hypothetical protein
VIDAEQRALQLAEKNPGAAELLRFAAGLLKAQASMRAADLAAVAGAARPVLEYCAGSGPLELAADARSALDSGFDERVRAYWETGEFDYLARAALAPWVRTMRETGMSVDRAVKGPCVYCGDRRRRDPDAPLRAVRVLLADRAHPLRELRRGGA